MKEKNVQISVIIPVYNAELYLEKCIESVLGQTFDALEVICVDDGSSDASVEILRKFQNKDERLIVLQQKNRGAGAARNNGLRRAKGKFIHFLDADDWVDTAYNRYKTTELFLDCMRNMFQTLDRNGMYIPAELEVEHHLVSDFAEDKKIKDPFILEQIRQ